MRCCRKQGGSFPENRDQARGKKLLSLAYRLALHTGAASALEYGLIVSMIAVLIAIVATSFDFGHLNSMFGDLVGRL